MFGLCWMQDSKNCQGCLYIFLMYFYGLLETIVYRAVQSRCIEWLSYSLLTKRLQSLSVPQRWNMRQSPLYNRKDAPTSQSSSCRNDTVVNIRCSVCINKGLSLMEFRYLESADYAITPRYLPPKGKVIIYVTYNPN